MNKWALRLSRLYTQRFLQFLLVAPNNRHIAVTDRGHSAGTPIVSILPARTPLVHARLLVKLLNFRYEKRLSNILNAAETFSIEVVRRLLTLEVLLYRVRRGRTPLCIGIGGGNDVFDSEHTVETAVNERSARDDSKMIGRHGGRFRTKGSGVDSRRFRGIGEDILGSWRMRPIWML